MKPFNPHLMLGLLAFSVSMNNTVISETVTRGEPQVLAVLSSLSTHNHISNSMAGVQATPMFKLLADHANVDPGITTFSSSNSAKLPNIIVQGDIQPHTGNAEMGISPKPGNSGADMTSLGPKQDDPGPPPPPDFHNWDIRNGTAPTSLGPKQDDPGPPPQPDLRSRGLNSGAGSTSLGPKQDDPVVPPQPADMHIRELNNGAGMTGIGPKQDDPATPPPKGGLQGLNGPTDGPGMVGPGGGPHGGSSGTGGAANSQPGAAVRGQSINRGMSQPGAILSPSSAVPSGPPNSEMTGAGSFKRMK